MTDTTYLDFYRVAMMLGPCYPTGVPSMKAINAAAKLRVESYEAFAHVLADAPELTPQEQRRAYHVCDLTTRVAGTA
jgi:hypothetical protein